MTEKLIFDAEAAIRTLRLVVFEKGADYTYENPDWTDADRDARNYVCRNFHGTEPGCIVGHVLHRLGLTAELAEKLTIRGSAAACSSCESLNAYEDFSWKFTWGAIEVLTTAQAKQDNRYSWGDALQLAENRFMEVEALGRK